MSRAGALSRALAPVGLLVAFCLGAVPAQAAGRVEAVTSPGGITAWLVEDHSLPVVSMDVGFLGGASTDPSGKGGLANFTADLLDEGAGPLDGTAFKGRIEDLATALSFNVDLDMTEVSLRTLAGNFEASVAQDFKGIGAATADAVARVLGGETIKQRVIYVPTKLVTSANAKQ